MNLASSGTTWCFSFHVLLTMLAVQDSAALAAGGGDCFVCWCEKVHLKKREEGLMSDGCAADSFLSDSLWPAMSAGPRFPPLMARTPVI